MLQLIFHLFGPHNGSLEDIKFKNDEDVQQHASRNFREIMSKSNITVRIVRFTVFV